MDSPEFRLVTYKKRAKRYSHKVLSSDTFRGTSEDVIEDDIAKVIRRILKCKEELSYSDFYFGFFSSLTQALEAIQTSDDCVVDVTNVNLQFDKIVCYGLGQFSSCMIARYQMALLLCLMEKYKLKALLYDPSFGKLEHAALEKLGCGLIPVNEEGKHRVDKLTLFYMPHCAMSLYNNLIWANWGPQLHDLVIIGNSFSSMIENLPLQKLLQYWSYISRLHSFTKEFGIVNCFQFNDIFNDFSVHVFSRHEMLCLPVEFWKDDEEPTYVDEDDLITEHVRIKATGGKS